MAQMDSFFKVNKQTKQLIQKWFPIYLFFKEEKMWCKKGDIIYLWR